MRIISGAGDEMCMHRFGVENVNKEYLEDLGTDGR
jgi:hypothetical protein